MSETPEEKPPALLISRARRWWPRCAKCNKTVEHAEVVMKSSCVSEYLVRCHGQQELHIVGVWAAMEYAEKGLALPDSFTQPTTT